MKAGSIVVDTAAFISGQADEYVFSGKKKRAFARFNIA